MDKVRQLTLNISRIANKRSAYMKNNFKVIYQNYSFSELHTIDYIGRHEHPNVTKISTHLGMTRGAISKIVKRLQQSKHISSYQLGSNRKEIYFKLTQTGKSIFEEHERLHAEFDKLDSEYFNSIDQKVVDEINDILSGYNKYLADNAAAFTPAKPKTNSHYKE